jgi:hypothetical protein
MVDGIELPMHPFRAFVTGSFNSVPLIAGNVLNEGSSWAYGLSPLPVPDSAYQKLVRDHFGRGLSSLFPINMSHMYTSR